MVDRRTGRLAPLAYISCESWQSMGVCVQLRQGSLLCSSRVIINRLVLLVMLAGLSVLCGAASNPDKGKAAAAVRRLLQQSVDADRDGLFERLLVSVEMRLPSTADGQLLATMHPVGDDSSIAVAGSEVRRVGAYSSVSAISVGRVAAGSRSFRLQFDGEDVRRLRRRGRYEFEFLLMDSVGLDAGGKEQRREVIAQWRARSGLIDPLRFGWRSAHMTGVEEPPSDGDRAVRVALTVHRRDTLDVSVTVRDKETHLWRGSSRMLYEPGRRSVTVKLVPQKATAWMREGVEGEVVLRGDDALSATDTWERRGMTWRRSISYK
jgi:hypothetical protein